MEHKLPEVDCEIVMADIGGRTTKPISQIVRGDELYGDGLIGSKVIAVIRTPTDDGMINCIPIDGLFALPTHPILDSDGVWRLPRDLTPETQMVKCDYYYTLLLDRHHIVTVRGPNRDIKFVTLNHGFTDNEYVAHDYFGTSKVVEDLQKCPTFNNDDGIITIPKEAFMRDKVTNWIIGIDLGKIR